MITLPDTAFSVFNRLCLALFLFSATAFAQDASEPWFSSTVESKDGTFTVTLQSTEPEFALNEFRVWQLTVTDTSTGEVVTPARVTVGGGMPMHGHGLPSQPQVTEYLGDGHYKIEGLRFNMLGKWVLEFDIVTKAASDIVKFELLLDY